VPALGLTLLVLLLWLVQGLGFVQWLAPDVRQQTVLGWILAMWLGLIGSIVLLVNLYYLIPGCTVNDLAWPVTLVLAAASTILYLKSARPKIRINAHSWVILILTALATALVLRPLIGQSGLGFYFSNNGEFSNYAAITDAVQFHDSATSAGGPFDLVSREAVVGIVAGVVSALTGKAALWVIEPVAAAFAALAFASLGLLFRHCVSKCQLGRAASAVIGLLYAWAILSASAQTFWTLSFVSQYLSVALFFGGLLFLAETRELARWRKIAVLGLLLAALVCVYPEMFVPSVGLLGAFEVVVADRNLRSRARAALTVLVALGVAVVFANRFGYGLLTQHGGIGASGWNIYGAHRPVLGFLASVAGFTNTFAGPITRHVMWASLTAVVFGLALAHAIVRTRTDPTPSLRGLNFLGLLFFAGVAGLFWIVVRRGLGNNYIAVKFILGFGWLAYLSVGLALARLMQWRPKLVPAVAAVLLLLWGGLVTPALRFTRQLHKVTHEALFLDNEGRAMRERLAPRTAYVAAGWFNYAIIGQFLAHDRDLISANRHWPDGTGQLLSPGQPIVLLGDHKLADDPQVTRPYRVSWQGISFVVMEPD
jgi:hypothetical protein